MNGNVSMADDVISFGHSLPRLATAMIIDGRRVRVTWRDGNSVIVDLGPVLLSHRHFIPLRDNDDLFQTLRVNEDGTALEISRRLVAMYRGVAPIPAHIALSARYLAEKAEKDQTN